MSLPNLNARDTAADPEYLGHKVPAYYGDYEFYYASESYEDEYEIVDDTNNEINRLPRNSYSVFQKEKVSRVCLSIDFWIDFDRFHADHRSSRFENKTFRQKLVMTKIIPKDQIIIRSVY